jgi:biotin-(acetyl-CoA carboxylase) ligase
VKPASSKGEIVDALGSDRRLDLPPPYTLVSLREIGDAFAHARSIASDAGAGTLVVTRRFDLAEFALVLEPEEPLASARRAFFAGMNAMADTIAAAAPPEREVSFEWPATLVFDKAIIGGGRLAWPDGAAEDAVPPWLVFGGMIRTVVHSDMEAGAWSMGTALEAEGFEVLDAGQIIESFSRHLMVAFDKWNERGFKPVGQDYLSRLAPEKGARRGIDANGDLLVHRGSGETAPAERRALVAALTGPAPWLDRETGAPLL